MKLAWILAALATTAWTAAVENEHEERASPTGDEVNWSSLGNAMYFQSLYNTIHTHH